MSARKVIHIVVRDDERSSSNQEIELTISFDLNDNGDVVIPLHELYKLIEGSCGEALAGVASRYNESGYLTTDMMHDIRGRAAHSMMKLVYADMDEIRESEKK